MEQTTSQDGMPPLPEPLLEGVDHELWGQNVTTDCYTADQLRTYGQQCADHARRAAPSAVAAEDAPWPPLDVAAWEYTRDGQSWVPCGDSAVDRLKSDGYTVRRRTQALATPHPAPAVADPDRCDGDVFADPSPAVASEEPDYEMIAAHFEMWWETEGAGECTDRDAAWIGYAAGYRDLGEAWAVSRSATKPSEVLHLYQHALTELQHLGYTVENGELMPPADGIPVRQGIARKPAVAAEAGQGEREAFEAFAQNCPMGRYSVDRKGDGYWSSHTQIMWDTWQARSALATQPAPPSQGQWLPIDTAPKGAGGLVDIFTDRRYAGCYWDAICGEYRHIDHSGTLIRLRNAKFWMPAPAAPTQPPAEGG